MKNRLPNNPLSANASPQRLPGHGVRRLNNRPLIIVGGIALVSLGLIAYVAVERGKPQAKPQEDDHGGSATQYAQAMAGDRTGGTVPRASVTPLPPAAVVPASVTMATPTPSPTPDEVEKQRRAAFLAALRAKPGVDGSFQQIAQAREQQKAKLTPQQVAMVQRADPNNAQDALDEYRHQLEQAQALAGQNNGYGAPRDPNNLANFNGPKNRWALNATVQRPATPYVIEPGWMIPATLQAAINSELPGMVTARVSEDVKDTPTGNHLLIPAGSMLVGEYSSKVAYGQGRVFLAFQRINFPDGTWLDIGAMPGASMDGTSGGHDLVDTHFIRTFGESLLMSVITAGVTMSQPRYGYGTGSGVSASDALSESLGQNLGSAMSQLLEKNLNVAPTLKLRPGYRFNVFVSKDIVFAHPYYRPDYSAN